MCNGYVIKLCTFITVRHNVPFVIPNRSVEEIPLFIICLMWACRPHQVLRRHSDDARSTETEWASVRATEPWKLLCFTVANRDVPGHRGLHKNLNSFDSLRKVCCNLLQLFLSSEVPFQINLKVWRFVVSKARPKKFPVSHSLPRQFCQNLGKNTHTMMSFFFIKLT